MPNNEETRPVVTFYGGVGPPIAFQGRYVNDDLDPEAVEQRSYSPRWAAFTQASYAIVVASRAPGALVSRELALAAARQHYNQQGIEAASHYRIPQRKVLLASHELELSTAKLGIGSTAETHSGRQFDGELRKLEQKVKFLEAQLQSQSPHLQLYRLGAGSLFVSIISLVIWLLTGTGIPFHPIFAAGIVPVSIGVIAMAFLTRPKKHNNQ